MKIEEDCDETKNLKNFIQLFHFFDCPISNEISVRKKIFCFCKAYFEADAV